MSNIKLKSYKGYHNIRHNTTLYFVKCPKCLQESKNPMRVKTHKNLSSLDFHWSHDHKGEYWVKQAKALLRETGEVITL